MPDYIGSKKRLCDPFIFDRISRDFGSDLSECRFLDLCSGTGVISQGAATRGAEVWAVDKMETSRCLLQGTIGVPDSALRKAEQHLEALNEIKGIKGFFFKNFSPGGSQRRYFTEANAAKIDACRRYIFEVGDPTVRCVLFSSLLEAESRILNTASHQISHLKKFKPTATKPLVLRKGPVCEGILHMVVQDVLEFLQSAVLDFDLAYLDPPYCPRNYWDYYHVYEDTVRNETPKIHGKTGVRTKEHKIGQSDFFTKTRCRRFLDQIVSNVRAPVVYISYSSDGEMAKPSSPGTDDDIASILRKHGNITRFRTRVRRHKESRRMVNTSPLWEWLFKIEKY